jgi:polyhydroxyalkanoate synthase subunit PhaC
MSPELTSGLAQLASYSTRAAKAAAALSKIRDEDVQVATTPREVVARIGGRALYRIAVDAPKRVKTPVMVVYAMVGHWTILDLQPDRSFLRNLAEGGCEVYMLDWGHPTAADQFDDFSDLVNLVMDGFIDVICDRHDVSSVNLLGVCQGGVLSLIYASLHPEKIRNLITCVTPVDFHADKERERVDHGFMNVWVRNLSPQEVDLIIDSFGNISGEVGGAFFSMMTPYRSLSKYCMTLVDVGQDQDKLMNFLRMEKWLADRPDHTAASARQWLKELYQDNKMFKGELEVGGRLVDLKNISMPVLNLYTETDHIIPPPASVVLGEKVGSEDYTQDVVSGGHIGVFVSRDGGRLRDKIVGWLEKR